LKVLLFLIYGKNPIYHLELTYSVLSAARFLKDNPGDIRLVLAADADNHRPDLPVEHLLITPEMLDQWQMGGTYNHAIKIYALHHVLQKYDVPTILIDSDTVFRAHPDRMFERINVGRTLMHARERSLVDTPEWSGWRALIEACDGVVGGQAITAETMMCNSGVLGLDPQDAHLMDLIKVTMHDIRTYSDVFTAEQLAASLVLDSHTELLMCDNLVEHYWDGPRAYYHYQMNRMFPDVLKGERAANKDWDIAPLDPELIGSLGHRIAARIKKLQRRADPGFAHAYMAYLSAISLRQMDPELANVWAITALNMLRWGLENERPNSTHEDFELFTCKWIDAQLWMQPDLRDRWRAYWEDTNSLNAPSPSQ
jgi:hypothetical protein